MSSGPKSRSSRGPTSPRGIYTKSVRAPGVSLDMPDGEPVKKRVGGKIKKMASGGEPAPLPFPYKVPKMQGEGPVQQRNTRMRKGGSVGSASKRADGCAVKGKTRGKFV